VSVLLAILATWAVAAPSIVGLGLWLVPRAGPGGAPRSPFFEAFWFGLAGTLALAQLWHLWQPINAPFVAAVVVLGALGILYRRAWAAFARNVRRQPVVVAAILIGTLWVGLMGLRPLEIYDAGLYHLQAIQWDLRYPTVPGLGNLHGRLAYHSSLFLLLAAFGQGPLAGDAYRAVVGLLALVFLTQASLVAVRVVRARGQSTAVATSDWLLALMLLPSLAEFGGNGVSTTSTDVPLFPIQVLIVYYVLRWLEDRTLVAGTLALVLAAGAATIKLSSLGFDLAAAGVVVVFLARSRTRPLPSGALLAASLIAGLLITEVVLSGYPFYPSTAFGVPVDWQVPAAFAERDRAGIELFARQPNEFATQTFQGWDWLPHWFSKIWTDLVPPLLGGLVGLLALSVSSVRVATKKRSAGAIWAVLIPVYLGIGVWFANAPAYRFVGALVWLAGAIPVAYLLRAAPRERLTRLAATVFVLVAVLPPQIEPLSVMVRAPIAAIRRGLSPVPVEPMITFVTDSGLAVSVPQFTDQAWAAPIPTTPVPDKRLRLRCANDMGCGFAIQP
jgi:hypothetical protein